MATVSDIIEQFILSVIGEEDTIKLSRNELANYFSVAPSQINYVLSTRFCVDRGYVVESKRGGGGGVTIIKISTDEDELLPSIIKQLDQTNDLTFNKAKDILDRLESDNILSANENKLIKSAISDKALSMPIGMHNLRKNILKEVILSMMRK